MYFGLMFCMVLAGVLTCSIPGLVSWYAIPPVEFVVISFFVGIVLIMCGVMILAFRIQKTGASYLIRPAKPGYPVWFYIYKDGEVRIVGGERSGEGFVMCKDLDADIPDLKSYSLADHKIRFVPEGCAHAVDLDMVEYAQIIDRKHHFENIKKARDFIFRKKDKGVGYYNE